MADNVTFTAGADATPPGGTVAATEELVDGSHAGLAWLLLPDGSRTPIPATALGGLLVQVSNASIPVTGGLTDAQLRATPVPVDVDAPLGQAAMAASIPVVVASNQSTLPVSAASLPLPTGAATLAEQQTQTASLSVLDDWDESDRAKVNPIVGQAGVQGASGTVSANTQRVVLATDVALPAGTNNIGDVDIVSLPNEGQQTMANSISVAVASDQSALTVAQATAANLNAQVVGTAAHASPVSGNPVYVAGRASTAVPTDVGADGDAAGIWLQRNGAPVITMAPHVGLVGSPWTLTSETAQYTTTQTSTVLVAGGASEKIVVTKVQIQVGGTTAGTLQLYFGTGAYSRGTNLAIFDGEFAPSATLKPGVIMDGPFIAATNGDDLLVTDSAAINPLTITVWYYVVT